MQNPVEKIVLLAKNLRIRELGHLAATTQFVEVIGKLIQNLQAERGASTIFLGSQGMHFLDTRQYLVSASESVEEELRVMVESQVAQAASGKASLYYLAVWVLLGLDELAVLRNRISQRELSADECIVAFSRLIASLISLIFEVADSDVDPRTSRLLVALFNLIQGREFAGQERAIGGLCFSSRMCDTPNKNRLLYLIDAQERHFQTFIEFADAQSLEEWADILVDPNIAQLERFRRLLCNAKGDLDSNLSGKWFEVCSERLSAIWDLQCTLVKNLKEQCTMLIAEAQSELEDSEKLLNALHTNPPVKATLASRIFDTKIPVENVLRFQFHAENPNLSGPSAMDVFATQSQRLINMETELAAAKRALDDRKVIERAKGILMARFNLTEDEAYKRMRTASMEQNKRLVEVGEAIITLVAIS